MSEHEKPGPPRTEKTRTRAVFPIMLIVTVFFASGNSMRTGLPAFPSQDKLVHFLLFGLLATLIIRVAYDSDRPWRSGVIAILATSLYGVFDELRQSFTPGRSVEVLDWVADTTGAIVATTVYIHVKLWRGLLEHSLRIRAAPTTRK